MKILNNSLRRKRREYIVNPLSTGKLMNFGGIQLPYRDARDYRMDHDYNPVNPFIPLIMVQAEEGQSSFFHPRHYRLFAVLTLIETGSLLSGEWFKDDCNSLQKTHPRDEGIWYSVVFTALPPLFFKREGAGGEFDSADGGTLSRSESKKPV